MQSTTFSENIFFLSNTSNVLSVFSFWNIYFEVQSHVEKKAEKYVYIYVWKRDLLLLLFDDIFFRLRRKKLAESKFS